MPDPQPSPLAIRLFGPFDVRVNGVPLPRLRSRKGQSLLALLTLRRGCELERAWLAGMLWPEVPTGPALATLRRDLTDLRRALGPEASRLRSPTSHTLCLDVPEEAADVAVFDAAVACGDGSSLELAVSLYRGPLLEGCDEVWVFQEREAREQAYLMALETLAGLQLARGEPAAAERSLRLALVADPFREAAQRALMVTLAAGGNFAGAAMAYRDFRMLLHRELSAEPDPETTALFQQIRAEARERAGERGSGRAGEDRRERSRGESGRAGEVDSGPVRPLARSPARPLAPAFPLEPIDGAVPLDSPFYVVRPTDGAFHAAMARRESLILLKGARQMGKTSLLGRGLHQARQAGARVILTDFQTFNADQLESVEALFRTVAAWFADQLELEVSLEETWNPRRGASMNFEWYLRREVLGKIEAPIVWGLDEVDRLFPYAFGSEVFGLFRSWHNRRVLESGGPWERLTLAMAYATEAHLFITDMNQSPFNVGIRLTLEDFTVAEVADLNGRYGSPLQDEAEVARFYGLMNGQPYLVSRGLNEMARQRIGFADLEAQVEREAGIFGDHLRRLVASLARDPDLCDVVRGVLQGRPCPTEESFYRLRSAGVIAGETARDARPRCQLYAAYLGRHLL